jgi:hypothetical protein
MTSLALQPPLALRDMASCSLAEVDRRLGYYILTESGQRLFPTALRLQKGIPLVHWIGAWNLGAVLDVVVKRKFRVPAEIKTLYSSLKSLVFMTTLMSEISHSYGG